VSAGWRLADRRVDLRVTRDSAYLSAKGFGRSVLALPQHPDKDRPQRPVLLAVDQELGERPRIEVSAISCSTTDYETANVSLEFVVKSTAV